MSRPRRDWEETVVNGTQAQLAKRAVAAVFLLNGLGFAALFARVPAVRDRLDLSVAGVGLLLLALSAGTLTALPLSGAVVHRWGPARSVLAGAVLAAVGFSAIGAGLELGSSAVVAAGLAVYGVGTSTWDVAMNVEGAEVERRVGHTLMPRLHAAYSIGTVGGALLGAAAARYGVPLPIELALVVPICLFGPMIAVRRFLPADPETAPGAGSDVRRAAGAWAEPRTLLIGLMVCSFALVEGVANDWMALAIVDGHDQSQTVGALGYGAFVTAMTLGRLLGGSVLDRLGRIRVLQATGALAVLGAGTVIVAGPLPLVLAGAAVWGVGASLGFPVGMSAAADDPGRAPARVAVGGSIGYTAFLAGPPLVGFLAEGFGVLRGLTVVLVAAVVGVSAATATRRTPQDASAGQGAG